MTMRTIAPFLAYEADAGGTGVPLLAKGTPGQILIAAADTTQTSLVATAYKLTDGTEFAPSANNHGAVEGFRVELPDEAPGIWFVSGSVASYQPTVEGSRGERGLPGPDAIENDETVGTYMATAGTRTRSETQVLVSSQVDKILDGRTTAILMDPESETMGTLEATFTMRGETFVNVKDYGAVGDGVTSDWWAFQQAANTLTGRGGGVLFIPKSHGAGHYITSAIDLPSNVTVRSDGAKITSTANNVFRAVSGTQKGYGVIQNLRFEGIVFQGDFTTGATAAVTLHHAQNVVFRDCIFTQVVKGNHAIDLGGCKDVTIQNCRFQGTNPGSTAAQYAEAIQLDSSNHVGMGGIEPDPAGYDGLPCDGITVENCVFEPITVGGTLYKAPAPIGTHVGFTRVNKNITFRNNIVDRVYPQTTQISAAAWLKFPGVRNLTIEGNTFKGDTENTRVIRVLTAATGMADSDVGSSSPNYSAPINQEVSSGIRIVGNSFTGFLTTSAGDYLISLAGISGKSITDTVVARNDFQECCPTGGASTQGQAGVNLSYTDGTVISENTVRRLRQFIGGDNCVNLTVQANTLRDVRRLLIDVGNAGAVVIDGNLVGGYGGGIQLLNAQTVTVTGNTLRYYVHADKPTWMFGHFQFYGVTRGLVSGNTIRPAGTGLDVGISWGSSGNPSTKGVIVNNITYDGIVTPVAQGAGSTATVSGNES